MNLPTFDLISIDPTSFKLNLQLLDADSFELVRRRTWMLGKVREVEKFPGDCQILGICRLGVSTEALEDRDPYRSS
ncbi:hypothetical protein RchiOBHm_Chr5g0034751 [Rosa chinensis]|uniref:Uncharacterized protein n=1 Tax=Rosa chinensis TaxID=74649 RepID=A0A2P6QB13_ROSCH|nr:hypothetical protein RchiOBHm_Chr5g0034751 [Rosa chinensis]